MFNSPHLCSASRSAHHNVLVITRNPKWIPDTLARRLYPNQLRSTSERRIFAVAFQLKVKPAGPHTLWDHLPFNERLAAPSGPNNEAFGPSWSLLPESITHQDCDSSNIDDWINKTDRRKNKTSCTFSTVTHPVTGQMENNRSFAAEKAQLPFR